MKYLTRNIFAILFFTLVFFSVQGQDYLVGTGQKAFTRLLNGKLPHDIGSYGYGAYTQPIDTTYTDVNVGVVNGVHSDIKARVITIVHPISRKRLTYVLFDLAFPSENIRRKLEEKLRQIDPDFVSGSLVLTATHTHSAPGGHSCYLGYENITPGHRPDILETIVENTYQAIISSWENLFPMEVAFSEAIVPDSIPIAFSRNALPAYNNNPERQNEPVVTVNNNYKATDRIWQMISFEKEGELNSVLNLFGAHPNRFGSTIISSDTRGAASDQLEKELPEGGVAIFAQKAPGDIDHEWYYSGLADPTNKNIYHPAYYNLDANGNPSGVPINIRVEREGEFLKKQALRTYNSPEVTFLLEGDLDYELIYIDMGNQKLPIGNYAQTLNPNDYYTNDFFLFPVLGKLGQFMNKNLKYARTSPPVIGLGAITSRFSDEEKVVAENAERLMRYFRLSLAPFQGDYGRYVFNMYRSQANKHVMLEGGKHKRALGVEFDGPLFGAAADLGLDPSLVELKRLSLDGLFKENTILPQIVPLQIVIIGNVALVNIPGEPSNTSGQRIERMVTEHLVNRNIKKVIVNGYCNENTGYIFTPEEYLFQNSPNMCGFTLYGKWTEPAFRYNFGKLAEAMLLPPDKRDEVLDRSISPPEFSPEWYSKASFLVPAAR
jgi:neutral ceramidase